MTGRTKIEWATHVWNPVVGCSKVSEGCRNCYAKELHDRRHKGVLLGAKLPEQYAKPFETIQLRQDRLTHPLRWKKPRRVFVNSMSDLFHEGVPDFFLDAVFAAMAAAPDHTFMILTKRSGRMHDYLASTGNDPLPNVWLGVSVENRDAMWRVQDLLFTPAAKRFISCEPLLGPLELRQMRWYDEDDGNCGVLFPLIGEGACEGMNEPSALRDGGIDWVIVGGESGPNARPMHPPWVTDLRDQCAICEVPFFFKQWGEWAPALPGPGEVARFVAADGSSQPEGAAFTASVVDGSWVMTRLGKKAAGNLIEGESYMEVPK